MKKILSMVILSILVLSGLSAAAFSTNTALKATMKMNTKSTEVFFPTQPTQMQHESFVELQIDGATTQLLEPTKPVLPLYVKTYEIPFGSTEIQVACAVKGLGTLSLSKEVLPARVVPLSATSEDIAYVKDATVYESAAFYPDSWCSYDVGAGRNALGQQVTFVKVVCYPVRYSPLKNVAMYTEGFDITLTYDAPVTEPKALTDAYDMVVIAPAAFESHLQPLIDFKNSKGVATMFKSMEAILAEYTGYDQPEQVKYFIKDAYDLWGVTYVLLVGGLKSHLYAIDKDTISAGSTGWWVPVRYASMPQDADEGCLCDLYYGCLYNATGGFDSWDSNGDGVYACWGKFPYPKDTIDLYPEVYVSRLPCTTTNEVDVVVTKILTYEGSSPAQKPWYKNFIGISGKTFRMYEGQPDGEYLTDLSSSYMMNAIPDLNPIHVYSTNRDTGGFVPNPHDISAAFNQGAGFVNFEGHGAAYAWNTIWFDGEYPDDWTGGINLYYFPFIKNNDQLPVVIVGGCHNALYNITFLGTLLDKEGQYFCAVPSPVCFSWGLVVKPRGGAIASTGCTGYGLDTGVADPVGRSAGLEMNFFWTIGYDNVENLAEAHSQAIVKYLNEHDVKQIDAFCITNWALFGDPSLKFGGYSS